jgi:hypothetical protein
MPDKTEAKHAEESGPGPEITADNRSTHELSYIAAQLAQINTSLLRAEASANERKRGKQAANPSAANDQ